MAYYNDDEESQLNPNEGTPAATGPQSSVISGGGSGGGSSNAPAAPGAPDKSGNFVGLQTYLDANKNQASKLGDQTAGIVSDSADQARNSVSGLNQKFNQQVDQNTVNSDQDAMGLVGSTPENLNADQRLQLKKQYNAQYKGPSSLDELGDDYSNAMKNTNAATQNLTDAQTEAGRGNLINKINNAPRTRGVTAFDNLLLQKGSGRDKLEGVVGQNKDVGDLLKNSQTAAQQKVGTYDDPNTPDVDESAGAKGTTAKTQADTFKSVQDALNAWKGGFNTKLADAQDTGLQSRVTKDLGDVGGGDPYLDTETLQALGVLNPNDRTYRLNLSDYMNPFNASDNNAANVATPEDYARYGALADIAGIQDPMLKQEDVGKAGTAGKFSIDQKRLGDDLKAAQDAYQKDYTTTRGLALDTSPFGGNEGLSPEIANATVEELEKKWLPMIRAQGGKWGSEGAANIQRNIDKFKNERGYNNMVKSTQQQAGNTGDGKIHAWI